YPSMRIDFFFDPACPWCWITSRWLVEVAPQRDLDLHFRPFSLLLKHGDNIDERFREPLARTHATLRLATAVAERHGDEAVGQLYTALGARIHHDRVLDIDLGDLLERLGLDRSLAPAADDAGRDRLIRAAMDEGLALGGEDVGVPLITFDRRAAYFGPVMAPAPTGEEAVRLWDGLSALAPTSGFFELKRTRDVGPLFGPRPEEPEVAIVGRRARRSRAPAGQGTSARAAAAAGSRSGRS